MTAIIVDCSVVGTSPEISRFTGPILRTSPVVLSPAHQRHRLILHFCSPQLAFRHPIGKQAPEAISLAVAVHAVADS